MSQRPSMPKATGIYIYTGLIIVIIVSTSLRNMVEIAIITPSDNHMLQHIARTRMQTYTT